VLSQAPNTLDETEDPAEYHRAVESLERMLGEGASWSGRERNCLYLNTHAPLFADVSAVSGLDFPEDARSCGKVDWDFDGDVDLWIVNRTGPQVRFLRNDSSGGNHFLSLRLEGTAAKTNRDAIGARVTVKLAGDVRPLTKTLQAGEGFLSQGSKWVQFGLGGSTSVERVTVRWPGGATEAFAGIAADRRWLLTQGSGKPELAPPPTPVPELHPKELPRTKAPNRVRAVLAGRMPMPHVEFDDAAGKRRKLELAVAKPLFVTFWASWCPICQHELTELAAHRAELDAAGLRVVALSLDDVDENAATREEAKAWIAEAKFPFAFGFLDAATVDRVRSFYGAVFAKHPPLPIPTSLLIDSAGRLAVLYKGEVDVDELVADARTIAPAPPERWFELALPLPGRRGGELPPLSLIDFTGPYLFEAGAEAAGAYLLEFDAEEVLKAPFARRGGYHDLHLKIAGRLNEEGKLALAAAHVKRALEFVPESPLAHLRAGELMLALHQDAAAAEEHFKRAVALDPTLSKEADEARRGPKR